MKKILFQGDSITDAGRNRESDNYKGFGYPTLVSAQLGYERPMEFEFINRGISGNRVTDLIARIKRDFINLAPDYVSILIGINDVWHEFSSGNGVSEEKFEKFYNILIEELKEALPNVKIMILEPFVLKGAANELCWETFRGEAEKRAAAAKRVAEKNDLLFVPLMKIFDEALNEAPASYWTIDGVHPTASGHELIKRAWLQGFSELESK